MSIDIRLLQHGPWFPPAIQWIVKGYLFNSPTTISTLPLPSHRSDYYFNADTKKMESRILGTGEAWESGKLGRDSRYVRKAPTEIEALMKKVLA